MIGLISVFFAAFAVGAAADDNAVSKKNIKSLNLNIDDQAILNEPLPEDICCSGAEFSVDNEPSEGERNLVEKMQIEPEFRYNKPDEYNSRLDVYDTEFKLNLKLPVDF